MTVFSTLQAALREGFVWREYQPRTGLHLVEKTILRGDGRKARAMAFAKPFDGEPTAGAETIPQEIAAGG